MPTTEKEYNGYLFDQLTLLERLEIIAKKENANETLAQIDFEKKDIYEKAGVEEYWIVSPQGSSVEIYYLEDGKYVLQENYILQNDREEEEYNAEAEIYLRVFPHIKMTLQEIFEGMD